MSETGQSGEESTRIVVRVSRRCTNYFGIRSERPRLGDAIVFDVVAKDRLVRPAPCAILFDAMQGRPALARDPSILGTAGKLAQQLLRGWRRLRLEHGERTPGPERLPTSGWTNEPG